MGRDWRRFRRKGERMTPGEDRSFHFEVEESADGKTGVVHCRGRLDIGMALREKVEVLLHEGRHVVLDLTDVWDLADAGFATLTWLKVKSKKQPGSELRLENAGECVRKMPAMARLDKILYDEPPEA
jgi:anti-anti-sigma factor